jgi:hypothetical protein
VPTSAASTRVPSLNTTLYFVFFTSAPGRETTWSFVTI